MANNQSGDISEFSIGADGALTFMDTIMSGTGYPNAPAGIVTDPAGKYVYVANVDGNCISQYTVASNGLLSPMDPDTVYAGRNVHALAVAPSGKFLYSVTYDTALVWAFAIGADGKLSFSSTATLPPSASALGVAIAPSGKYLYVANSALPNQAISQFTVASDGSLTAMTPATVAAYEAANCVTVDPSGKYLYSTSQYSVSQFTIANEWSANADDPSHGHVGRRIV